MNISYARFSSHLSRGNSIEDQHRVNIQKYADLGVPESQVTLIEDRAIPGTHEQRPGYQKMMAAVEAGEVKIIIVDDQSRLTRAPNIGMLLEKFVFHDVRFIAVADGVDTEQEGTEVNAQVKGLVNNLSNKSHGKRVRRGLVGRVLDGDGSAGDHPYGYSSTWEDPESADKWGGHGPKPKRKLFINEVEAKVVRWIFEMFTVMLMSINQIARELNKINTPVGNRSKVTKGWSAARVKRMLTNEKYIGEWRWGENKVVKLNGKRRYIEAKPENVVVANRPNLAIITIETWDAAVKRFEHLKSITGQRPVGRKRGFKGVNFREYTANLLSGVLFCGECGARLHYIKSVTTAYFKCPVHARDGGCSSKSVVIRDKAEQAMVDFLRDRLVDTHGWIDNVYREVCELVAKEIDKTPEERQRLVDRYDELQRQADNLVANMKDRISTLLQDRLEECERELAEVNKQINLIDRRGKTRPTLPTLDAVKEELRNLLPLFTEDPTHGSLLLRRIIRKVEVFDMIFPGKKRGYAKLRFRFNPMRLFQSISPAVIRDESDESTFEDVELMAGEPSKLESLLPQVHEWIQQGVAWKEIGRRTGMSVASTKMYYKRWREAVEVKRGVNNNSPASLPDTVGNKGPDS